MELKCVPLAAEIWEERRRRTPFDQEMMTPVLRFYKGFTTKLALPMGVQYLQRLRRR